MKSSHYQGDDETLEASSPYRAWKQLLEQNQALRPGDLLEVLDENGHSSSLLIGKYIGFEPAAWFIPEVRTTAPGRDENAEDSFETQR